MKTIEHLKQLRVGDVVTNKAILSTLKRAGLIHDYSQWGYLEHYYYYSKFEDGYILDNLKYLGKEPKDGEKGSRSNPYLSGEPRNHPSTIVYKGYVFGTKYLSGCFNAYLEYLGKEGKREPKEVNPTISLYGNII